MHAGAKLVVRRDRARRREKEDGHRVKADAESVTAQLRKLMAQYHVNTDDILRGWDYRGGGDLNAEEFRLAVAKMGYQASPEH